MNAYESRSGILSQILVDQPVSPDYKEIINIFGEPGLGKTDLLCEAQRRLGTNVPVPRTIFMDLRQHAKSNKPHASLLLALCKEIDGSDSVTASELDRVALKVVHALEEKGPCYLFFDSTEYLQDNDEFWSWFETNLLIPLLDHGQSRFVFAGRIHAPFREYAVRQRVEIIKLQPLCDETVDIIKQELAPLEGKLNGIDFVPLCRLIAEVAFGNLSMLLWLCEYTIAHPPEQGPAHFKEELYAKVVFPKTKTYLLARISGVWQEILWWTGPLKHFDQEFVKTYLAQVAPELVKAPPGIKQPVWIKDVFPLYSNAIVRKDLLGIMISDSIQNFLCQSMLELAPDSLIKVHKTAMEQYQALTHSELDGEAIDDYVIIRNRLSADFMKALVYLSRKNEMLAREDSGGAPAYLAKAAEYRAILNTL